MMREFTCVICSKVWVAESKIGLPPRVCSSECFKEMQRATAKKRRAIYNLPESELISMHEIFERDKQVCYLCGKQVERKDASQDHVIPISKGGPHTRANIKLAHLKCNMIKHDRLITSLL